MAVGGLGVSGRPLPATPPAHVWRRRSAASLLLQLVGAGAPSPWASRRSPPCLVSRQAPASQISMWSYSPTTTTSRARPLPAPPLRTTLRPHPPPVNPHPLPFFSVLAMAVPGPRAQPSRERRGVREDAGVDGGRLPLRTRVAGRAGRAVAEISRR